MTFVNREQEAASRESPIQAQTKSNIENLLDLDFNDPSTTTSSVASPITATSNSLPSTANVDDLLGLFSGSSITASSGQGSSHQNNHQNNSLSNDLVSLF